MKDLNREPVLERKTCISYKTEEKTVVRGYDIGEMAEKGYGFTDMLFVIFQGRIPTKNEKLMLEYENAEFLEHSMSPSAASAICVQSGRPKLPAAVASGVMTFGGAHGPGAAHSYLLVNVLKRAQEEGKSLDEIAKIVVDEHIEAGHSIMGIHQPQHINGDPRAIPTINKAKELGTYGLYQELQEHLLKHFNAYRAEDGKEPLYLNMIGAGNSSLLDLGFSGLAGWIIGTCARGFSCACHAIEALKKKRAWSASVKEPMVQLLDLSMIQYEGRPDRVVPTQDEREAYAEEELRNGEWEKWNL